MAQVVPSEIKAQLPAYQFNQPVSENALQSIGGLANFLFEIANPIGTIVATMLTESDFQDLQQYYNPSSPRFILADGRDVSGTPYATITGNTNVPDLRGVFIRGKNNGRSDGNENPAGDLALGTFSAESVGTHGHAYGAYVTGGSLPQGSVNGSAGAVGGNVHDTRNTTSPGPQNTTLMSTSDYTAGVQTQPDNVTINYMIRIQ